MRGTDSVVGALLEMFGIVLFVSAILWYIFPWLPDRSKQK